MARIEVGSQTGIEASRQRENELHPQFPSAWNNRAATLSALVNNDKDTDQRLSSLEQALLSRPF